MHRLRVRKHSIHIIPKEISCMALKYSSTGYRGLRLARRMYEYRKELCETFDLKAIMFGGRIPNYHKYADKMRPKDI